MRRKPLSENRPAPVRGSFVKRALRAALAGAVLGAVATPALGGGDLEQGAVKAIPCMGCHGIPGYFNVYPSYHVPKVGGQHPEYIVAALKAYQSGERSHPTMRAQAATLTEQDMEDIAAYFAAGGGGD